MDYNLIESKLKDVFLSIDQTSLANQKKVLDAFRKNRISETHFSGTTGYGYGDGGREKLALLFAEVFSTEAAIVSPYISGGTHAISLCLHGVLRPLDKVLSITGKPYDTLGETIWGEDCGSLRDYDISFDCINLLDNGQVDMNTVLRELADKKPRMIYVQRSRGYDWREPLTIGAMRSVFSEIKSKYPSIIIMVDNCYGEFVDVLEPTDVGADLIAGSLIKNPGGGISPTGGYICGPKNLIEKISFKLTAPGVGTEVGSYAYGYRAFFQGLFLAPHITAQALKSCVLFTAVFDEMGYQTLPKKGVCPRDIISSVQFSTPEEVIKFCQSIQASSPVDSFVTPYPWDMPGYDNQVIMAAGAFIQGSSIELSCDAPIKAPYRVYIQGGLTYEHAKIAIEECVNKILNDNKSHQLK